MSQRTITECDICALEIHRDGAIVRGNGGEPMHVHKGECLHQAVERLIGCLPVSIDPLPVSRGTDELARKYGMSEKPEMRYGFDPARPGADISVISTASMLPEARG